MECIIIVNIYFIYVLVNILNSNNELIENYLLIKQLMVFKKHNDVGEITHFLNSNKLVQGKRFNVFQ